MKVSNKMASFSKKKAVKFDVNNTILDGVLKVLDNNNIWKSVHS